MYRFSSPSCIVHLPVVLSTSFPSEPSFDSSISPVNKLAHLYSAEPKSLVLSASGNTSPVTVSVLPSKVKLASEFIVDEFTEVIILLSPEFVYDVIPALPPVPPVCPVPPVPPVWPVPPVPPVPPVAPVCPVPPVPPVPP